MANKHVLAIGVGCVMLFLTATSSWTVAGALGAAPGGADAKALLEKIGMEKGVCAVLGLPEGGKADVVKQLAQAGELLVYFQSPSADEVAEVRKTAEQAGLLGNRIFVDQGDWGSIHLADNLAGAILVSASARGRVLDEELLRVLHPEGRAILGDRRIVKPFPQGADAWSHVYHGPNNNPQSADQLARAPYLTQFLADPKFCPMPEMSVAAGGKVYRAFGHIAHKANQNAMLNTLICVNAYNGTILWKRKLKEGFMIHRNTMIATPDTLYMGDDQSCKLIDAATGRIKDQIAIPEGLGDGPVWKWMALVDGVLYALVGAEEVKPATQSSDVQGLGHWPWGMWEGHEYKDPRTSFGFGRTLVAINAKTKKVLWSHNEKEYLDSRGVCMQGNRIYYYSPEKFLGCLNADSGQELWKNADAGLLEAIGPNERAQHYVTGYSTQTYIKCNDRYVFFAGPHRSRLVVARAEDGKLLWQKKDHGNFQLVLRQDAIYAAGPQQRTPQIQATGYKLAYETGDVLAQLPMRRACTRATGSIDSVFYRTSGGTVRIDTATDNAYHIAPMRPPCQDGVIISEGHLYWGPWMCGCQFSLYGHICLAPANGFNFRPRVDDSRLTAGQRDPASVRPLDVRPGDWPAYRGNAARTAVTQVALPKQVAQQWRYQPPSAAFPTAPVAAGGLVFVGDRNGAVHAVDAADGKLRWRAYTAGAIYFPPEVADGRVFVGSADGRVYAFEAATGRRLWTFQVAPADRWIFAYGKLISTWPVSGGVVVQDGTVYAAAGIAHYDGTHVVALDAVTGKVKWYNDTSGTTSKKAGHGVSLQGNLHLAGGELRFVGGGVHETARYNLHSGKCLNQPSDEIRSAFHTSFYAYFPDYGKYLSLSHKLPDGKRLIYDVTYEGSRHTPLALFEPLPPGVQEPPKPVSRWAFRRQPQKRKAVWQLPPDRRFNSFIVAPGVLLVAGHVGPDAAGSSFVAAINLADGRETWRKEVPGPVVKGGTAVDCQGRIIVSLENGQVLCFVAAGESN